MDKQTIELKEDIINSVVKELSKYREEQNRYSGIAIVLCTKVPVILELFRLQTFSDELKARLDNNDLRKYSNDVRFSLDPTVNSLRTIQVDVEQYGTLSISIIQLLPRITAKKGTLKEQEYTLDCMSRTQWDIGRGEHASDFCDNYIVIKNDENNESIRTLNEHVSRTHAKILYENDSFYLQAKDRGAGYTRLTRNGEDQTIRTTNAKIKLSDGDYIKLGSVNHFVLLSFKLN